MTSMRFGLKLCVVIACLALQAPTDGAAENAGSDLTPSQILKVTDLTPKELDYYNKVSDPDIVKNFIIARSYVRLYQKVNARELPAEQLPDKPLGFSTRYLLPGEATLIRRRRRATGEGRSPAHSNGQARGEQRRFGYGA